MLWNTFVKFGNFCHFDSTIEIILNLLQHLKDFSEKMVKVTGELHQTLLNLVKSFTYSTRITLLHIKSSRA